MKVLIIKTSSLGDVVHTLPALTDATAHYPDISFDWVVEEGFAEVPSWHQKVDRVIPVALRRWRKNLLRTWRSGEWRAFKQQLDMAQYDAVIDAQGLLKSAWLTRHAQGPVYGLDKNSAREPVAARFYQHPLPVAKGQHAVERTRQLFAQALGYDLPEKIGTYGIDKRRLGDYLPKANPYIIFLHGTTWPTKHWPEAYWVELAQALVAEGYNIFMPWGNEVERERAERVAQTHDNITVLPRLSLGDLGSTLLGAVGVVAVDTGLGHLSAALNRPTVSLYGPTSPGLVGTYGDSQVHLVASEDGVAGDGQAAIEPQVFAPLVPVIVLERLKRLLR